MSTPAITYDDFLKVDIRVGTVVSVDLFPEARQPAYKLGCRLWKRDWLKEIVGTDHRVLPG